jgi:hypothetical protein
MVLPTQKSGAMTPAGEAREQFEKWGIDKFSLNIEHDGCYQSYSNNRTEMMWMAWQAALSSRSPETRWIAVSERLPKFGILVLVANESWHPGWPKTMHGHLDSEGAWCGHYADLDRCGQPTEKGLPTDEPTHWMPIPEFPSTPSLSPEAPQKEKES